MENSSILPPPTLVEHDIDEYPVDTVYVYQDRAEVTRNKVLNIDSVGEYKIIVHGITQLANGDSIRVKTLSGALDILEVSHDDSYEARKITTIPENKVDNSNKVADLRKEVEELETSIDDLTKERKRYESKQKLIQAYATNMFATKDILSISLEKAKEIIDYHQHELEQIDQILSQIAQQISIKEQEIKIRNVQLSDLSVEAILPKKPYARADPCKRLIVVFDVKSLDKPLKIQFSYVVNGATWSSSYDIRVDGSENTLSLQYFAEVTQKSNENWTNCKLFLSTSNPAIGSAPPKLPMKQISLDPYNNGGGGSKSKTFSKRSSHSKNYDDDTDEYMSNRMIRAESLSLIDEEVDINYGGQTQMQSEYKKAGVIGSGDAGSTIFTINRLVTIDSDNKPHKVMITARQFKPQIVHYVVPSVSAYVYLQAKFRNTSPYPLLASNKVNIYLDGNFMSKNSIKQASSGETLQLFIGVDPAIKVEYLPIRTEFAKKGWMSGTEVKKVLHSTILHNTKSTPIKVIMAESLPRSTTDKITIELIEPSPSSLLDKSTTTNNTNTVLETSAEDTINNLDAYLTSDQPTTANNSTTPPDELPFPNDFIMKNKSTNNIVWLKTIASQQKIQLNFSYRIVWPQGSFIQETTY